MDFLAREERGERRMRTVVSAVEEELVCRFCSGSAVL